MSTETETSILNIAVKAAFRFDCGACCIKKRTQILDAVQMGFLRQAWTRHFTVHPTLVHSSAQIEQQKFMYIVSFYRKEK